MRMILLSSTRMIFGDSSRSIVAFRIRRSSSPNVLHKHQNDLPKKGGLGIEIDRDQLMKANKLYIENCLGARDDAKGMQYLIPGWTFDPKRPCMVR